MKLTEKDKKLLYLLCIIVIIAAFAFLLIKPQFERRGKLSDRLTEAENEKSSMEILIASAPASDKIIEESTEEYTKVVQDFYPIMNSNQIEQTITKMVLSHQLTSVSLNVSSQPELAEVTPYFASMKAMESETTDEQTDESGGESSQETESENKSTMIYASQISVSVSGNEENMKTLIDTICRDYPAIRITGFQMNSKTGIGADNQVKNVSTMNLTMELYMCAK